MKTYNLSIVESQCQETKSDQSFFSKTLISDSSHDIKNKEKKQ
jgi:hypothetical protein